MLCDIKSSKGITVTSLMIILALALVGVVLFGFMVIMIEADNAKPPLPREIKPRAVPAADPWDVDKLSRGKRES